MDQAQDISPYSLLTRGVVEKMNETIEKILKKERNESNAKVR